MNTEFENYVMKSLGKIEKHMEVQNKKDEAQDEVNKAVRADIDDLKCSRDFVKGAMWWAGSSLTIGSAAWLLARFEHVKQWFSKI